MIIEPFDQSRCDPHAIVREEDIQLILDVDSRFTPPHEELPELEARALRATGHLPGSVVVRPGRPLVLLAIIHDLDREPSCCEEWIRSATLAALDAAHWRGLTRIAMPLLGTVHGGLDARRATGLLAETLARAGESRPGMLWLEADQPDLLAWLRERTDERL